MSRQFEWPSLESDNPFGEISNIYYNPLDAVNRANYMLQMERQRQGQTVGSANGPASAGRGRGRGRGWAPDRPTPVAGRLRSDGPAEFGPEVLENLIRRPSSSRGVV